MKAEWATAIRDACLRANIAFFFKQWGGKNRKAAGRLLDGKIWDQMPISP
jgi:protein gp37